MHSVVRVESCSQRLKTRQYTGAFSPL